MQKVYSSTAPPNIINIFTVSNINAKGTSVLRSTIQPFLTLAISYITKRLANKTNS